MNWYKISQASLVDKKPYNIYKIEGGRPDTRITVKGIPVIFYATSSEQARFLVFEKYPQLKAYVDGCLSRRQECDIEARIDEEKLKELENYKRTQKEQEEKQVQKAWWNQ